MTVFVLFGLFLKKTLIFFNRKIGATISCGGTRNGGEETTNAVILNALSSFGFTLVNGGIGTYTGGCLWSNNERYGADKDETGILNCRKIGRKVALFAQYMQAGIEAVGIKYDEIDTGLVLEVQKE